MVKVFHSEHASNNPKAYYKKRFTVDDVLNSRFICKPLHLLDCCVETDNGTCDHRHPRRSRQGPATAAADPRRRRPLQQAALDMHYQHGPISRVAGYYAKEILWPNAGVGPEDVDVTGSYDAFTFTTMLQLEDYGFCKKGEGGEYVSDGTSPWAASGPTTPRAGICARATPTA
jgi:acetyl-CoA acetyltransferase